MPTMQGAVVGHGWAFVTEKAVLFLAARPLLTLAKAFAKHILVFCPPGQPMAVQNRSRRFCRGELTEQWRKDNPDLITGHNSADALLEKIKAEREAMKPAKKTRKRKSV